MITELTKLLEPHLKPELIAGLSQLISDEVAAKKGLTGVGIKTAFGTIRRLKPNLIERLLEALLPHFIEAISPLYQEFLKAQEAGVSGDLKTFLSSRAAEVTSALLSVTDSRAAKASNATLKGVYQKLRPIAEAQVSAAVPMVASLLNTFTSR